MRLVLRAGLLLGLATAACKDSVGPKSLANPQQTTEQMAAFDTLFAIPVLASFNALGDRIDPNAGAPAGLARVRALARASNPLAGSSALRPYSKGVETTHMLRELAPGLINASAQDLFPVDVDGKTFEWDTTGAGSYQPTARAGAPNDGVRFILYAVDLVGQPVEPLVEVGYVEFDDESTASLNKVHVRVAEPDGSPVYVDYTVSLASLGATSARLVTSGYITNGSPDTLDFTGSIDVSASTTTFAVTQDVSFDVDSRDAHVRLWERVTLQDSGAGNVRIYFLFKHGTETVTLDANFDIDTLGQSINGSVTIKVDGGLFATCQVDAAPASYSLTCEGADADGLNADEVEAIAGIGKSLGAIESVFQGILLPATGVIGGAM